jgi:hypothetical protein
MDYRNRSKKQGYPTVCMYRICRFVPIAFVKIEMLMNDKYTGLTNCASKCIAFIIKLNDQIQ